MAKETIPCFISPLICDGPSFLLLFASQLVGTVRIGAACPLAPLSVKENRIIKKKNVLFE
jgi:hypothetical protein